MCSLRIKTIWLLVATALFLIAPIGPASAQIPLPPIAAPSEEEAPAPAATPAEQQAEALLGALELLHKQLHTLQGDAAPTTTTALAEAPSAASAGDPIFDRVSEALTRVGDRMRKINWLQWLEAFMAIFAALILRRLFAYILRRKALTWAESTRFDFDDILVRSISRPLALLPLALGFLAAGLILGFQIHAEGSPTQKTLFGGIFLIMIVFNIAWAAFNLVDVVTHLLHKLAKRTETTLDDELVPLISKSLKIVVVLMAFVTLGGMVGGPFKGILAGLGLGGLAFALAAKDTVANLFGYAVIFADRPFRQGDTVMISGVKGNVEELGVRSLKIRTLEETLVTIPNAEVANAQIENFTRRDARRVFFHVGLTYDTNADQMEEMTQRIREILKDHPGIWAEKSVVTFENFGASSLDIRVYYFTRAIGLAGHLKTRHEVNLSIMRAVDAQGLSMAFPTRTLHLEATPEAEEEDAEYILDEEDTQ